MSIMGGLLIPNEKFDLSIEMDNSKWKMLLAVDLFYLNFLKDARFIRSNDLLYVYCTEYNLQDVVGHMHPNSSTFSAFKLRMAPFMQKFYCECVAKRLSEMFGFYKGAIQSLMDNPDHCFYGSKILENSLTALTKDTDPDQIDTDVDDIYLTLKNYLKLQNNQTPEVISNEVVKDFMNKLETLVMVKNEGIGDDQLRRKFCRLVEVANLFLNYTRMYVDPEVQSAEWRYRYRNPFDNSALINFEAIWKRLVSTSGSVVQKGIPYRHIDIDAAVCIFPETTEYPLLKEEFTKQNRPSNPTSEHLINDWMLHWFFTDKLSIEKKREDKWKKEDESL